MKQKTVKRAVEAWRWIHTNPHHIVGTEFHPVTGEETHVYLQNYHEKLRMPIRLFRDEISDGIRANKREFDTRMFALTRKAKMQVTK